jgi:hypothetical protein
LGGTALPVHYWYCSKPRPEDDCNQWDARSSTDCRPSDLVRDVKKSSSSFIKQERFSKFHFEWQVGYGVFSYSHSHLDNIAQYIMNQKEHHKKKTFKQEYLGFLKKFEIEFKEEYAFSWIADA